MIINIKKLQQQKKGKLMKNIHKLCYLTLVMSLLLSSCAVNESAIVNGIAEVNAGSTPINNSSSTSTIPVWKTKSDGSHLPDPTNKDFYTRSFTDSFGLKETYPSNNQAPRAYLLMTDKFEIGHLTKRAKNLALCQGFMDLPFAYQVLKKENAPKLDDQVITYMYVKNLDYPFPTTPPTCNTFIDKVYDYKLAKEEITRILGQHPKGKAPYIVLIESKTSPRSSMVLSLGDLSAGSIRVLARKWPILIRNVYLHGAAIDPTIGISMTIDNDPELIESEKQAIRDKISILTKSLTCGAALAGTTITYASVLAAPECTKAVRQTAELLGYSSPV